jgi:glucose-6-phosphate isomerase
VVLQGLGRREGGRRTFVAVSTNAAEVAKFGIDTANMFGFWDWVGGRYSMDSAIGLSTMIAIGPEHFRAMLAGFHAMDEHFRTRRSSANLPVLMGLLAVWYNDFFGAQTVAVLPYEQYLKRFPRLPAAADDGEQRQARHARRQRVDYDTGPIYWGEPRHQRPAFVLSADPSGHAAHPLRLHRFRQPLNPLGRHHDMLMANVFAQAEALAFGKTAEEVKAEGTPDWLVPHGVFEGNRPSNTILAERLTPEALGKLVALYEHSVFTQGAIWNIDSFDQWGVELGKALAQNRPGTREFGRTGVAPRQLNQCAHTALSTAAQGISVRTGAEFTLGCCASARR